MIRTLIADDEPAARDAIALLLAADPDIQVVGQSPDGPATLAAIEEQAPDLLFLDIRMPGMDGFSILREVDERRMPVVVFVTAYDQYALRAFEAHALDYLLKPFDDERFHRALAQAKRRVLETRVGTRYVHLLAALRNAADLGAGVPGGAPVTRVMIRDEGRELVVDLREVDWIEADGDTLRLHAGKTVHTLRQTMARFEESLDPSRFVRIHRSIIVQMDRIRSIEPYYRGEYVAILRDGTRLKVSRNSRERLRQALAGAPP